MPYAANVYSLPPGTEATTLTPVDSSDYNAFIDDIEAAQNAKRPVVAGGTGGDSVITGWDGLAKKGTDIADGASINLTTATGPSITMLGSTTLTAVTLAEGSFRLVRAAAAKAITASATLLCNGSASVNMSVVAEDLLIFRGGSGGVVDVVKLGGGGALATTTEALTGTDAAKTVTPDALAALWEKGSNVASAGTVSLGEGGFFHITGTTTITDIDFATAKDGRGAWLEFDGILTLTHNGTTLTLPGGANITTAAGDRCYVVQDNADNAHVMVYQRYAAAPPKATGGLELLTSGTVSAAATLDIVLTSYTGYRGLKIFLYNFQPATDAVALWMRFSSDGGSSYDASGYGYSVFDSNASAGGSAVDNSASAAQIKLNGVGALGNGAAEGTNVEITLLGQTSTALWSKATWTGVTIDSTATPDVQFYTGGGARRAAQDTDAIRFLMSSGNIASGSYAVYGLV
jgi:hypothetical protein